MNKHTLTETQIAILNKLKEIKDEAYQKGRKDTIEEIISYLKMNHNENRNQGLWVMTAPRRNERREIDMAAKLIRVAKSDKAWYFDSYYFECIQCGREFSRCRNDSRINPYCGICKRKIEKEKQKSRNKARENKIYNNGRQDMLKELEEFSNNKLDLRFALDILCKQVIDEFITEKKKEGTNDEQTIR